MLPPEAKSTGAGGLARCAIHASWNTFEGSKFPLSHVDFGFRFIPSPKTTGCKPRRCMIRSEIERRSWNDG